MNKSVLCSNVAGAEQDKHHLAKIEKIYKKSTLKEEPNE